MNYHLVMLNKNTKFWRVTVFTSVLEMNQGKVGILLIFENRF